MIEVHLTYVNDESYHRLHAFPVFDGGMVPFVGDIINLADDIYFDAKEFGYGEEFIVTKRFINVERQTQRDPSERQEPVEYYSYNLSVSKYKGTEW